MKRKTNEIIIKEDCAAIIITPPNKKPFECLVDKDDVVMLKNFYWYLKYDKRHPNCAGYIESRINKKRIFLHLFVMPRPNGKVVDHINGNPFDNRKCNLRICEQSQNCRNRKNATNIYYNKRDDLYKVMFNINKKNKCICYTRDYEEAEKYATLGRKLLFENKEEELLSMPCKRINLPKNNTSGYIGVTKVRNKYQSWLNNKYLGTFNTPEEAYQKRLDTQFSHLPVNN